MPMKKKPKKDMSPQIKQRLAHIRAQNVERHAGQMAKNKLRADILKFQNNQTIANERDRLLAASVHGHLAASGEKRLTQLKEILV